VFERVAPRWAPGRGRDDPVAVITNRAPTRKCDTFEHLFEVVDDAP